MSPLRDGPFYEREIKLHHLEDLAHPVQRFVQQIARIEPLDAALAFINNFQYRAIGAT
jgi:hypothetical protein